ncbi:MAG: hypothetical protein J0L77_08575 [Alphaproteobacteria bacterium]|nr:hypothetical protein [Alphaproteobacteria bacterium]
MTSRIFYIIDLEGETLRKGQNPIHLSDEFSATLSFDRSLSTLETYLAWFDGRFEGWYEQDNKKYVGTARVSFLEGNVPEDHVMNSWTCVSRLPVPGIHRSFCPEANYQILPNDFDRSYGGTCP